MRIKPVEQALCVTAALVGIGSFIGALRLASTPLGPQPGRALPLGIVCLMVGFSTAALVTWRGRWF